MVRRLFTLLRRSKSSYFSLGSRSGPATPPTDPYRTESYLSNQFIDSVGVVVFRGINLDPRSRRTTRSEGAYEKDLRGMISSSRNDPGQNLEIMVLRGFENGDLSVPTQVLPRAGRFAGESRTRCAKRIISDQTGYEVDFPTIKLRTNAAAGTGPDEEVPSEVHEFERPSNEQFAVSSYVFPETPCGSSRPPTPTPRPSSVISRLFGGNQPRDAHIAGEPYMIQLLQDAHCQPDPVRAIVWWYIAEVEEGRQVRPPRAPVDHFWVRWRDAAAQLSMIAERDAVNNAVETILRTEQDLNS